MGTLVMIGQLILALAILVTLHELGHYTAARIFGIKIEKFYLFFDAWGFKLFKFKKGDTEYGIGWLPLGGYVKIAGMIDESLDTEQLKSEPQPWEFRSKPAWQRLIVMIGGVTVNIILGIVIYIGITWKYGESHLPNKAVKHGIMTFEMGRKIGLKDGDKIIGINGHAVENFDDLLTPKVLLSENATYNVERDGQKIDVKIPDYIINKIPRRQMKEAFFLPRFKFVVDSVLKDSAAYKAGIKKYDRIIAMADTPVAYFDEFKKILNNHKNKDISAVVLRGNDTIKDIRVHVTGAGTINISYTNDVDSMLTTNYFSFGESITKGFHRSFDELGTQIFAFGKLFSGKLDPTRSVQGPIGMAKVFGTEWNWFRFWTITALLSMILAFMNMLPIPALDGGHVLFLLVEMIIRRPLSERFMQITQVVGMVILLTLMVLIFGNDIYQAIFD